MLYPYLVSAHSGEYSDSCVVVASTSTQAKQIAFKVSSYMRDWDWIQLRAHRVKAEEYLNADEPMDEPHWVYDIETLERYQEEQVREFWRDVGIYGD